MGTKMTPFVDLGEAAEDGTDAGMKEIMQDSMPEVMKEAIKELPRSSEQGVVKVQLTEDDIRDIMEAVKKETEEAETHSITKTDLVEMAVERLREMEDKLEIMEVMENLKMMDHLVILETVAEGDIVRVSDHPDMDGMEVIEFDEET